MSILNGDEAHLLPKLYALGFRNVCRILAELSKSDVRNRCMENLHFMGHKVAPSCANCVSKFLSELYHDPLFGTFLFHSQECRQGRSSTRCNYVECKALKIRYNIMKHYLVDIQKLLVGHISSMERFSEHFDIKL